MKTRAVLAALGLFASGSARAEWFSKPSTADIILQSVATGVPLMDMSQTLGIRHVRRDELLRFGSTTRRELNPVLGPHPADGTVYAYFGTCIALNALAAYAAPRPWRTAIQAVTIGWEGGVVARNIAVGAQFAW